MRRWGGIGLSLGMGLVLSGCAMVEGPRGPAPSAAPGAVPQPAPLPVAAARAGPVPGAGQAAAALDATTAAERAAARAAPAAAGERSLGRVVVALGNPAEQGFWLRSPQVGAVGRGRVVTASGASVAVELRPGTGAALLSLAAFRALGLGLTELPDVEVLSD